MQTDYEKQAGNFLASTGTVFEAKFLKNDKYFPGDKETRDIYEITLTRGARKYTFNFGQSIANSGAWIVKDKNPRFTRVFSEKKEAAIYAGEIGTRFNVRPNPDHKAPTAYSVLAAITKHDPGTLEDFCSEMGMNQDSITDNATYNAVLNEYLNVSRMFSDAEIEQLQEIQ